MAMERFGDLLLMERLAAGGMAEVFRAKQLGYAGFEKTVALKRILPHFATSDEFKSMFRMEANLSAMLQHTNITQVFSNGEHEGYLYLVMEFVDGKNLRQLLAKADKLKFRIPLEISCFIVSEALKGLDYAHNYHDERTGQALNIVHRDVSPQNIMLGYEGAVKVVDFGIAKAASKSESTRAGVLKGKFGYMSPEQARGEQLDRRSDIFSMGIILWELITQRRLFTYEDEMKTLEKVRECKVTKPSEKNPTIPYSLEKICMKALEKDSGQRYATSGEFYADLVRHMNDRHPNFIPTDFSKFMKDFYKEEIAEEKKKREKLNMEAPAFMAENPSKKGSSTRPTGAPETSTTRNDSSIEQVTQVSASANVLAPPVTKGGASGIATQDLKDLLNRDPSQVATPSYTVNRRSSGNMGISKRIQVVIPNEDTRATVVFDDRPKRKKNLVAGAIVLVLAMATYGALTIISPYIRPGSTPVVGGDEIPPVGSSQSETFQPPSSPPPSNYASSERAELTRGPGSVIPADEFVWNPQKYLNYGTLSLNGVPDADVIRVNGKRLVDGKRVPIKTPLRDLKLPPGRYEIELVNTVFSVYKTIEVVIEKNKSTRLEAILDKR